MTGTADILAELGLSAGTVTLAYGLVRGAKSLERDASAPALKFLASLLKEGSLADFGKAGATLVPFVFDKIFGTRPFSLKFIARSFLATSFFWLLLLFLKRDSPAQIWGEVKLSFLADYYWLYLGWYFVDWLSLVKARAILKLLGRSATLVSGALFFVIDISLSLALTALALLLFSEWQTFDMLGYFSPDPGGILASIWSQWFSGLGFATRYLDAPMGRATIDFVMVPSTLLTSVWTLLFLVSSLVVELLAPVEQLRRFTLWWFRDIDKHPLTAIAKVAATLLVVSAGAVKAVQWLSA